MMKSRLKTIRQLINHLIDSNALKPREISKVNAAYNQLEHALSTKNAKLIEKQVEYLARVLYNELNDNE